MSCGSERGEEHVGSDVEVVALVVEGEKCVGICGGDEFVWWDVQGVSL